MTNLSKISTTSHDSVLSRCKRALFKTLVYQPFQMTNKEVKSCDSIAGLYYIYHLRLYNAPSGKQLASDVDKMQNNAIMAMIMMLCIATFTRVYSTRVISL